MKNYHNACHAHDAGRWPRGMTGDMTGDMTTVAGCLLVLLFAFFAQASHAACFDLAGKRYGVNPTLLQAIAQQESGFNPRAINRNGNGSYDMGLMQINSSWLPKLGRYGIKEADLWDPCTNVLVGAWILSSNIRELGPTLNALGAYNARDPQRRLHYARQVIARWDRIRVASASSSLQVNLK